MKEPKLVTATQEDFDDILNLAKAASFPAHRYQLLEDVLSAYTYVTQKLQDTKLSLSRFRQMLFGKRTEKAGNLLKKPVEDETQKQQADEKLEDATLGGNEISPPQSKRPGHGRNGAAAYRGAAVFTVEHACLKPGDQCPACRQSNVYGHEPKVIVRVTGQPPLAATVFRIEQLRCRMCEAIFTAPIPEAAAQDKYDASAASMIALLRYGSGLPSYRLEKLQACLNVPLSDATQWDVVSRVIDGPRCAYEELIRQAAQGEVLHNDDTPARILDLMGKRAERAKAAEAAAKTEVEGKTKTERKAINTSGIVALLQTYKIVLFFTGRQHAGENLADVLAHRDAQLKTPIQMCDPLSQNFPKALKTLLSNCLVHARRQFVDIMDSFEPACLHVINLLAAVYKHDAHCRDNQFSPEARLHFHQGHSAPLMEALKTWMTHEMAEKRVEPNSGLGKAMNYMLKRWDALTLFLRVAGAPLDNNIAERALKMAILYRKGSLFYKSENGAKVGDIYMSLIYTCQLCGINPFAYLQALQRHADSVRQCPNEWLPWNYHQRLADSS